MRCFKQCDLWSCDLYNLEGIQQKMWLHCYGISWFKRMLSKILLPPLKLLNKSLTQWVWQYMQHIKFYSIVTFLPFKNVYYMSSLIANRSKNKYVFQFHSNSLLFGLLLCCCSNLYNNNYNYNSLFDTTIHNRNSSVRYAITTSS